MDTNEKKYNEALEKARKVIEYYKSHHRCDEASIEDLEGIFPELKESEDERMRKAIIRGVQDRKYASWTNFGGVDIEDVLDWLEKQGEQKYTQKDIDDAYLEGMAAAKHELEKQGEKPQIQHKYNVGDWIVNKYGDIYQVKEVMTGSYNLLCTSNAEEINSISQVDNNSRLLTMHDIQKLEKQGEQASASTLTQEEVQKLHDHLEMHKELGDFEKPIEVNVDDLPDNPVDAYAKGVEKARSEMKSEQQTVTFIDSGTMQVIEKLDEIIGKLGNLYEVLAKPYMYPPTNPISGIDVWYKTHGVERVPTVTCNQNVQQHLTTEV